MGNGDFKQDLKTLVKIENKHKLKLAKFKTNHVSN